MKKLMIAAVVCMAAVASQAAAITWQWTGTVYNGYKNSGASSTSYDGKTAQAGKMYIFNGDATDQATVLAAIVGGTSIDSLAVKALDSYTTSDGLMAATSARTIADPYTLFKADPAETPGGLNQPTHMGTGSSATKEYIASFYAMVIDDNIYLSDMFNTQLQTAKDTVLPGSTIAVSSAKFQGDASEGFTAGGWYTMAVPEPTSGLLLLLGVAGLALRRRHA